VSDVLAIGQRRNNAEAIRDIAAMGYMGSGDLILDATYESGKFWKLWQPNDGNLFTNDLYHPAARYHYDFRDMPWEDGHFTVVVLDPPYKLKGTGGSHPMDESYGVATPYEHWTETFFLYHDGIDECVRVLADGGVLLLKVMDQVSGGEIRWTKGFINHAERLGCTHVDRCHVKGHRAQPKGRVQRHFGADYSTFLIFTKEAA
jgi:hypothetical protein